MAVCGVVVLAAGGVARAAPPSSDPAAAAHAVIEFSPGTSASVSCAPRRPDHSASAGHVSYVVHASANQMLQVILAEGTVAGATGPDGSPVAAESVGLMGGSAPTAAQFVLSTSGAYTVQLESATSTSCTTIAVWIGSPGAAPARDGDRLDAVLAAVQDAATPACEGYREAVASAPIGLCSKGLVVELIQEGLVAAGFVEVEVDGHFGPRTERAVRLFQGLTGAPNISGRVDDSTWSALSTGIDFSTNALPDANGNGVIDMSEVQEPAAGSPSAVDASADGRRALAALDFALEKCDDVPMYDGYQECVVYVLTPGNEWHLERMYTPAELDLAIDIFYGP